MKVFLGNAPWSKAGYYGVRAGSRWPHFEEASAEYIPFPFFLAYGAALLEAGGHEVSLIDAVAEAMDDQAFLDVAAAFRPALVLLEVSTISIDRDMAMVARLRQELPEAVIALAGLHAFMHDPSWLDQHSEVDLVLVGEYEATLREVADRLGAGARPAELYDVLGLVQRLDGKGHFTGRRPLIEDLDSLPWPARHHLPMMSYRDEPGRIPRPSVQIWASRGCPFTCSFCAWPQIMYGNHQYRVRSIKDTVDEMEWLVREWGFASVYFDDDTFNIGRQRMLDFAAEVKARRLGVPWAIMARADTMDMDVLAALNDAGLTALKYGVESSSQAILDNAGKRLKVDRVREVVRRTKELGIRVHLTFMFGLPGETKESMQATLDLALELDPESVQLTIATPFPGSRFYNSLKAEGRILTDDFERYDGFRSAVIRTDNLEAAELEEFVCRANQIWRDHVRDRRPRVELLRSDEPVTVVVPNLNGEAYLGDCLSSLLDQTFDPKEIIVVDDGSKDGSCRMVREHYSDKGVRLLEHGSNRGFAAAANTGIKEARGRYIALLNNDAVADPEWLSHLVSALQRHREVGSCASKILLHGQEGVIDSAAIGLTRSGYSFNVGAGIRDVGQYDSPRKVFGPCGAAAIYRRELFNEVGLFDEAFFAYMEDVDLAFRAQIGGFECLFVPEARVVHRGAATTGGQYNPTMVRLIGRNTLFLLIKNMPRSVLQGNYRPLLALQAYLMAFHTIKTGHPLAHIKGVMEGLIQGSDMVAKRKKILGSAMCSDEALDEVLRTSEEELRQFIGKSRWRQLVFQALGVI